MTPIFPLPLMSGGQVRLFNIIKRLSEYCRVSLLSLVDSQQAHQIVHLSPYCTRLETVEATVFPSTFKRWLHALSPAEILRTAKRLVFLGRGIPFQVCRFYHREMEQRLKRMLVEQQFDVIEGVYPQMAPYLLTARKVAPRAKFILEEIDLSFISKEREKPTKSGMNQWLASLEHDRMRRYSANLWPLFDRVIAMSETDRDSLLSLMPTAKVSVVPNGVDTEFFVPPAKQGSPDRLKVAFLGGSQHYPNVDAMKFFATQIAPRIRCSQSDFVFKIIGAFDGRLIPQLPFPTEFTGYVDDMRPHLCECSLLIVPLRIGGGTRLKILEAMSLGVPVLTTTIGCEGIEAVSGRDVIVVDDPQAFADQITAILADGRLRERLSRYGRQLVEQRYSWPEIVESLVQVYQEVCCSGVVG